MKQLYTLFVCVLFVLSWDEANGSTHGARSSNVDRSLRFRSDGTFKILQFTDLHYGEEDEKDVNSTRIQELILRAEDPDLVILTGDMVSGYAWDGSRPWLVKKWKHMVSSMVELGYRWALALGNHDDQADLNRRQIIDYDQTYDLSLTQQGPETIHGATNYYLPVFSYGTNESIVANLWFFDSMDKNCLGVPGWGCVHPDQVQWYRESALQMHSAAGRIIPGLGFMHIPLPEYMNMWNFRTTYGRLEDTGVCCFSVNTGLFAAMKEVGDMISVHCGHDHDNDFFGYYENITLAYGRKTGYGGYGPPPGWLRGARVIQLTENPFTMDMWIRQEDGTVVTTQPFHEMGMNATYACCDSPGLNLPTSKCRQYEHDFRRKKGWL